MHNKKWYLSKTLWFAIGTALVGVMTALATQFPTEGWIITMIGVINFFLRLATNSEIK